ncbi:hypothetical protein CG740_15495 [Streptomyces sp. CB01201]|nr:hypothetical protein CG740_15495 [Streptomyces sp. CB01201]
MRDAAIAKHRARRDANTGKALAGQRSAVRKAPARQAARKALRRSAARFQGRRILAALLSLPLGLLGCLTSPLGRKLGLPWLIHPGRRLYRRITGAARDQRAARDAAIREDLADAEDAADKQAAANDNAEEIVDWAERPDHLTPVPEAPVSVEDRMSEFLPGQSGFRFEEVAEEMYQAAGSYDPEGCMEILSMVIGLPWALMAVANTFQKLAERSDSEFPLEKEVAEGFTGVFQALMKAVEEAEELVPTFKRVHEQDIARHEDPRNGPEAEKGWNV